MKTLLLACCLFYSLTAQAQSRVDWDGMYELQLSDFQSQATEIEKGNMLSLQTGSNIEFAFAMSNAEYMFTKNFNSKVNCSFNRDASSLVASDSASALDMLNFAR